MHMQRIAMGLWIALASVSWADSASTTQPATMPSPQVVALVNDLTSNQFSARESAQKKLEAMGDDVVGQLESLMAGNLPDEARARIAVIIRHVHEAKQFGPSIITIHCKNAPLEDVLRDFAQQAGGPGLGLDRPQIQDYLKSHTITLDLDHADFWTALQAVEDASGLRVRPDTDGQMILDNVGFWFLQAGDRSHACVAGPCLIAPQSVVWSTQFNGRGSTSFLNLQLIAMVEPKIHLAGGTQGNWIRECVDENGHSLVPQGISEFAGGRQWWVPLSVNLRVFPGMGTKIARLKGEMELNVQLKTETIEFDNILGAKNLTKFAGGGTVIIQDCLVENNQYVLHLLGKGPPGSSIEELFRNPFGSSLQIQDALGQPLPAITASRTNDVGGLWAITYAFNMNGRAHAPQRLYWEMTTESRKITLPFELDDLDLLPPQVLKQAK
jgi:hypothetical protein